jgi:GNAT superfamily N-acetyltransferase
MRHGKDSGYALMMRMLGRRAGIRAFRFFRRSLDPEAPAVSLPGLELRVLREPDIAEYYARPELDLQSGKVRAAFARGDLCDGAFEGRQLVGYCWFAFAPLPHLDGVWVDFHTRGVWMYKSLVLPSHRGRGIAPALYRFTDRLCAERGRGFSISCIETHNRPSIAAIRRTGYAPAGYAGYFCRERRLLPFSSPAAQDMSVRFYMPDGR